MQFKRQVEADISHSATQYPVVTILGPRQSGKTTTVRTLFSKKPYANLEIPDVRALALSDPRAFLRQYPDGVVLDEIQRAPDLLSYIQAIVDEHQKPGEFILTGSQQLALNEAISQSLAGRTDIIKLLPLSLVELATCNIEYTAPEYIYTGFYPKIYAQNLDPTRYYRNYFETYVERDVRRLLDIKDLMKFELFVKLCAGRIGQLFNANHLANEVGVSTHTINSWLSVLEASFIVFRLPPYFANMNKRLIKTPKIYFYDVGLASYLLSIQTQTQIRRDPLYGNLFENMVVVELLKTRYNQGQEPNLYFYRDSSQREVDLLYKSGQQLTAIEIKSAATFTTQFLNAITYLQAQLPKQLAHSYIIYDGDLTNKVKGTQLLNFVDASKALQDYS